jgi:hypothetical protein
MRSETAMSDDLDENTGGGAAAVRVLGRFGGITAEIEDRD